MTTITPEIRRAFERERQHDYLGDLDDRDMEVFAAGYEAGRRWISVDERLPENGKQCLTAQIDAKCPDEPPRLEIELFEDDVWQGIEEWREWVDMVAKPEGSYIPSIQVTHWQPITPPED